MVNKDRAKGSPAVDLEVFMPPKLRRRHEMSDDQMLAVMQAMFPPS